MIVHLETKSKFREDIDSNRIEEIIEQALQDAGGGSVGKAEARSWKNSLPCMDRILQDEEIPGDTGVAIEFNIPNTGKRIDFILTGTRQDGQRLQQEYAHKESLPKSHNSHKKKIADLGEKDDKLLRKLIQKAIVVIAHNASATLDGKHGDKMPTQEAVDISANRLSGK